MGAIASSPAALVVYLVLLAGLVAFLAYAWFTRYRENWDELLRKWSARRDDERDRRPPPDDEHS
ncbi:hypothetical protein [Amycolatopsis sp. DG1A-15b]|uniref:hypothetical protein n=1 Tax=Amycolatopsis sp. DG1A-15b TaxID=3052846 RepID=UPI00255C1791|nr:hypothetical protein [Amycolatopsis sp. DG1A-15b]WIX90113.1 hypothetical protein QRY02_06600 [Amycolatopsis sp. DG1A-15b]